MQLSFVSSTLMWTNATRECSPILRGPRPSFGSVVENLVAVVLLGRRRQKRRLHRPWPSAMACSSAQSSRVFAVTGPLARPSSTKARSRWTRCSRWSLWISSRTDSLVLPQLPGLDPLGVEGAQGVRAGDVHRAGAHDGIVSPFGNYCHDVWDSWVAAASLSSWPTFSEPRSQSPDGPLSTRSRPSRTTASECCRRPRVEPRCRPASAPSDRAGSPTRMRDN